MKKKLSELTKLERHWVLAECSDKKISQMTKGKLIYGYGRGGTHGVAYWNPDTDKGLMYDLMEQLSEEIIKITGGVNNGVVIEFNHGEEEYFASFPEGVQKTYIYHKKGNEVEVPELGESE